MKVKFRTTNQLGQVACYWAFGLLLVVLPENSLAESGSRRQSVQSTRHLGASPRVFAEPIFSGTDPYQPDLYSHVKLPVAANGYSLVALRDQQKWVDGRAAYQAIFDGQLYWFSNRREKAIFSAAPDKYAPVLAGDCMVTFLKTGKRIAGDPRYGVVHQGRVYFFAEEQLRGRFQSHPERYQRADIVNEGNCVVCRVDLHKKIQGLAATIATVRGLRYYFVDAHRRAIFLANLNRYGAIRMSSAQAAVSAGGPGDVPPQLLTPDNSATGLMGSASKQNESQALADAQPLAVESSRNESPETIADGRLAMEGYCPVSIREQGLWVRGESRYLVEHLDKVYYLAGEAEKKQFLTNLQRYLPMLGGACVVTLAKKNEHAAGSVLHSVQYNERLYLFVGAEEKRAFKVDPTRYFKITQAETESALAQ